ncbi:GNAT family N-acetyltransferase [Nocardioides sp. SYSU D00065]|uniref:GNAT family N-acetyltransferase n=1 Tax=Nocardioides sp. SYSU D00065 TaxID=2817378 RepID=UPI001B336EAC|nr:GNAT family N-acetyltransferase [Nocardioides sp. SYSU D00065]
MIEIVEAGPEDWALVRDVRLRALADSPEAFGTNLPSAQALPEQEWRDRLSGPHATFLAMVDGHPAGMGGVLLADDPDVAWIWGMWTDPAVRGRGVGRRFLEALVDWATAAGRTPYLHVTEGNDGARALYVSCGFVPTGVRRPLREGSPLQVEEMALTRG